MAKPGLRVLADVNQLFIYFASVTGGFRRYESQSGRAKMLAYIEIEDGKTSALELCAISSRTRLAIVNR